MSLLELLTALSVAVITVYAVLTYFILRANRSVVHEMREQNRALHRAYVVVGPYAVAGNPLIRLRVENIGRSPAMNLRLTLDRPFHPFGTCDPRVNLQNVSAFSRPIASLPPGGLLLFNLSDGSEIFREDADPTKTPTVFTVKAAYETPGQQFDETTTVDLEQYRDTAIAPTPLVEKLDEIKKAIEKAHAS